MLPLSLSFHPHRERTKLCHQGAGLGRSHDKRYRTKFKRNLRLIYTPTKADPQKQAARFAYFTGNPPRPSSRIKERQAHQNAASLVNQWTQDGERLALTIKIAPRKSDKHARARQKRVNNKRRKQVYPPPPPFFLFSSSPGSSPDIVNYVHQTTQQTLDRDVSVFTAATLKRSTSRLLASAGLGHGTEKDRPPFLCAITSLESPQVAPSQANERTKKETNNVAATRDQNS